MEGEKGSRRQLQTVGRVGMMAIVAVYVGARRMEDVTMMLSTTSSPLHATTMRPIRASGLQLARGVTKLVSWLV